MVLVCPSPCPSPWRRGPVLGSWVGGEMGRQGKPQAWDGMRSNRASMCNPGWPGGVGDLGQASASLSLPAQAWLKPEATPSLSSSLLPPDQLLGAKPPHLTGPAPGHAQRGLCAKARLGGWAAACTPTPHSHSTLGGGRGRSSLHSSFSFLRAWALPEHLHSLLQEAARLSLLCLSTPAPCSS